MRTTGTDVKKRLNMRMYVYSKMYETSKLQKIWNQKMAHVHTMFL